MSQLVRKIIDIIITVLVIIFVLFLLYKIIQEDKGSRAIYTHEEVSKSVDDVKQEVPKH